MKLRTIKKHAAREERARRIMYKRSRGMHCIATWRARCRSYQELVDSEVSRDTLVQELARRMLTSRGGLLSDIDFQTAKMLGSVVTAKQIDDSLREWMKDDEFFADSPPKVTMNDDGTFTVAFTPRPVLVSVVKV